MDGFLDRAKLSQFLAALRPELTNVDWGALARKVLVENPQTALRELPGRLQSSTDLLMQYNPGGLVPNQPPTPPEVQQQLLGMAMDKGMAFAPMGIVSPSVVKQIRMETKLPIDETFAKAIQNTPGAQITEDGLLMSLQRMQKPEQAGKESVRGGVFYLPRGAATIKHYKPSETKFYGGAENIAGETLYKNPLFVKGATGGKAPEAAYDQLLGKGSYEAMRKDALRVRHPDLISDRRYNLSDAITPEQFLAKYAPDLEGMGDYIFRNSRQGNQLAYALQEAAVGSTVRNAGFDSVLGYSKKRTGDPFISEVFDVREATYPTKEGGFSLMPQFQSLLD